MPKMSLASYWSPLARMRAQNMFIQNTTNNILDHIQFSFMWHIDETLYTRLGKGFYCFLA